MNEGSAIVHDGPRGPNRFGFLSGGGELGALIRGFDWRTTSLGAPETWPQNLRMAIRIMLTSRQPIWIGWGEDLTYFYNDAYKSIIGGKHPWALGRPTTRGLERNMARDRTDARHRARRRSGDVCRIAAPDHGAQRLPGRNLLHIFLQPDPERRGSVGGIFCANSDDTQRVIGARQLALLRDLAADATHARNWRKPASAARPRSRTDARDTPVRDDLYGGAGRVERSELAAVSGIERRHPAAPETIADQ